MRKLLALMLFATLSAQAQMVVRNNFVPDVTLSRDLGSGALWFDSAYVSVYRGATLSLTGNASVGGTLGVTGAVTLSNLTASRLVATDGSKVLVSTITAANLLASVTGTTGTGDLVFDTAPDFATSLSMGGTQWMDASRNLSNIGTLSSGAITAPSIDLSNKINFTGNSSFAGNGEIFQSASAGIVIIGNTGSTYDFLVAGPGGADILRVPMGTVNVQLLGDLSSGAITASGLIRTDRTGANATIDGSNYSLFLRNNTIDAWTTMYFSDGISYDGYIGMFGSATSASRLVKINHNGADDIYFDGNNDAFIPSGSLTVAGDAAVNGGDLTTTAAAFTFNNDLFPLTTDTYDIGSSSLLWRKGWLSELESIVFAQNTITINGGWNLTTHGAGTVEEDVDGSETAIDFDAGGNLAQNDFVIFRGNGAVEYMQIGTNVSGNTWNVTRNVDGSGANTWAKGAPYANLGYNGDGRIEQEVVSNAPKLRILTQGTSYNTVTEKVRLGYLADITDPVIGALTGYGLYTENAYLTGNVTVISAGAAAALANNSIQIGNITGTANSAIKIANTGTTTTSGIYGYTSAGAESFALRLDGTAGIAGLTFNNSALYTGSKTAYNDANAGIHFGTDGIGIGNNVFTVSSAGALVATSATITGSVTASSGAIGGFTIGASTVSATNLSLTSGAANTANITVGTGATAGGLNSVNAAGDIAIWVGATHANRANANFRVSATGTLYSDQTRYQLYNQTLLAGTSAGNTPGSLSEWNETSTSNVEKVRTYLYFPQGNGDIRFTVEAMSGEGVGTTYVVCVVTGSEGSIRDSVSTIATSFTKLSGEVAGIGSTFGNNQFLQVSLYLRQSGGDAIGAYMRKPYIEWESD